MTTLQKEAPVPIKPTGDNWFSRTAAGQAVLAEHERSVAEYRRDAIAELRALETKEMAELAVAIPAAEEAKARLVAAEKALEQTKRECLPLIGKPEQIRRSAGFQKSPVEAKLIRTVPGCVKEALQQVENRVDEIHGLEDASDVQGEALALIYRRADIRKLGTSTASEPEIIQAITDLNAIKLPVMTAAETRELHAQCQPRGITTLKGLAEFSVGFMERMRERALERKNGSGNLDAR
jgi:hypothetical protein